MSDANPGSRITSESSVESPQKQIPDTPSSGTSITVPLSQQTSSVEEPKKIIPASAPELLEEDKIIKILHSDSAIEALLQRLKKSINTCEEFGKFIRKKAQLESDHEEHLKKISRSTQESLKNTQTLKNDSFVFNFDKIVKLDERISQNQSNYSKQLFLMHDELTSLGSTISRQRKSTKENFKRKEREVIDAISSAEKAKTKYDQLCLELERVRTTDPSKKTFTLKGSKTTSEQEEILQRKIEAADADYRQKVSTSTGLRSVFLNTFRPNTATELKNLIIEIDIAMSVQLQKYASKTEDLALQTGLNISPLPGLNIQSAKSIASSVNNERDLYQFLLKNVNISANKQLIPVEYKQHPSMIPQSISKPRTIPSNSPLNQQRKISTYNETPFNNSSSQVKPTTTSGIATGGSFASSTTTTATGVAGVASNNDIGLSSSPYIASSPSLNSSINGPRPMSVINNDNVPLPPGTTSGYKTFGTPIAELIEFEGEMVPSLVRQCIYVVDKYGLELEGIYRTSGNIATVNSFKDLIDKDPSNIKLILPNPNAITDSDIYAVASLLKQFFSLLPEALLTNESSRLFLEYAKISESDVRLKKIHQVVYELPDGSYWTLRSLIFHLSKVASKQDINLMNSRNLGIIWGPTLFPKESFNASDMSYQGKLIEELIIHANDIFEAE